MKWINYSVSIRGKKIIHQLNMEIEEGISVLLGPNGSGKSTLLKSTMGHPDYNISGSIFLDDINITKLNPKEKRKLGISLMVQNPPRMDIKVSYFMRMLDEDWEKLVRRFGLEEFLERELFKDMSGGEKKLLEFIISVIGKPKVLLLDEPDSGVDFDNVRKMARFLENYNGKILIVTHTGVIAELLKKKIKKVFIMKNGKLAFEGGYELIEKVREEGYGWVR